MGGEAYQLDAREHASLFIDLMGVKELDAAASVRAVIQGHEPNLIALAPRIIAAVMRLCLKYGPKARWIALLRATLRVGDQPVLRSQRVVLDAVIETHSQLLDLEASCCMFTNFVSFFFHEFCSRIRNDHAPNLNVSYPAALAGSSKHPNEKLCCLGVQCAKAGHQHRRKQQYSRACCFTACTVGARGTSRTAVCVQLNTRASYELGRAVGGLRRWS